MIIRIQNLRLPIIIGVNDWERETKQDVIINLEIDYPADAAIASDDIDDACNYKTITKRIIAEIEESSFYLIEKLADVVLRVVLEHDKVQRATVRVDKPHALRFTDSVSVELTRSRDES